MVITMAKLRMAHASRLVQKTGTAVPAGVVETEIPILHRRHHMLDSSHLELNTLITAN